MKMRKILIKTTAVNTYILPNKIYKMYKESEAIRHE